MKGVLTRLSTLARVHNGWMALVLIYQYRRKSTWGLHPIHSPSQLI